MRFLIFIVFMFIGVNGVAQSNNQSILDITYLEYVDYLPKNLITDKSIGILIADTREEEVALAEKAHPYFVKAGVDVVAYFHAGDLFGGKPTSIHLAKEFVKREIAQMIILEKKENKYRLVITPFSKNEKFIKQGKKAWMMDVGDISDASLTVYRKASKLERKNFLISDAPEIGKINFRIKGQRYEAYKPDLKNETLSVELFQPVILPENLQNRKGIEQIKVAVDDYNQQIKLKNEKLKSIFSQYPFPVRFLEKKFTDKELRDKGYNYVLRSIHSTSYTIRDIFKYDKKSSVSDFVVVRVLNGKGEIIRVKGNAPVYKYYVKQIPSDSYYLGTKWDVDYTWEAALTNHLQLLVAEIK